MQKNNNVPRGFPLSNGPALSRLETIARLVSNLLKVSQVQIKLLDLTNPPPFFSSIGLFTPGLLDAIKCHEKHGLETIRFIGDAHNHPYFSLQTSHLRFFLARPFHNAVGECVGILYLGDQQPKVFSHYLLSALEDFFFLLEREIVLFQQEERDDLTGLIDRRTFFKFAKSVFKYHEEFSLPLIIMFMDLNGFKKINDKYGHAEGDRALILFGSLLQRFFRKTDLCARFAGDEFVVMLPKTNQLIGEGILDRFCKGLLEFNKTSGLPYNIDVAIGKAEYNGERGMQLEELLILADSEMYLHKKEHVINHLTDL
ncbi:GGDEF domain-containing protein [Aeromonas hydrophila]|uniref:GGDEF domain-containing protein n=1 Tax=Aeromonas hydrophila TaxID=644 RepID=UPI00191DF1FB|nr:GGDEF domain-containing protein [Aeromonas hydrophila]MBL0560963.1 GGDEF domain-containing protein [Aeromonas hydrophila]